MPQTVAPPLYSQLEVTPESSLRDFETQTTDAFVPLLKDIRSGMDRNNELLEELIGLVTKSNKQRNQELHRWREAHPQLARECRAAADALGQVQAAYLERLAEEARDSAEEMVDGEFLLGEFVDRFGPRLAHLHGLLQTLSQFGTPVHAEAAEKKSNPA